jgi:ribosomal protein S18 acetylase RimI-like enzyme
VRTDLEFVHADSSWLAELAQLAETCQRDPTRHCAYASIDAAAIAEEVADIASWESSNTAAVVMNPDRTRPDMVGWLVADVDEEMSRIWWWGPFVDGADWAVVADSLYAQARADLVERVPGAADFAEEMAIDSRAVVMQEFAIRHGFRVEEASACLVVTPEQITLPDAIDVDLRPFGPGTPDAVVTTVAALHDALFPNTHLPGHRLVEVDDRRSRLVAMTGDAEVAGYVAVERQHDASLYIDFVGVAPRHGRRGIGRALVAESCRRGFAEGALRAHLTVRVSNLAAQSMYRSLGFEEDRMLVPLRRGIVAD